MNRFVLLATALGILATAGISSTSAAKPDPNREAAKRPLSLLQNANWNPLFNGKNLKGWTGDTTNYVAQDGVLVCRKGAKSLVTEKEYSDFAFTFDFKLEESGNNGIGIRVPKGGYPSRDGMEIQVLDHNGKAYQTEAEVNGKKRKLSWLKPSQYHGSIYGICPAKTGYLRPVGQWNTETIVAIEDHIMVILNGAVIVDTFLDQHSYLDGSVRSGIRSREGHLMLAGHNDHVEFRNLKLADFSPSPAKSISKYDNTPPPGFKAFFNGKDLTGWKGLTHRNAVSRRALKGAELQTAQTKADENMRANWSVVEGVLNYTGKGQSLCTAKDYGDFEMYVDWKIPPGADSGIYLRGTPQIQIWDPWDPRTKGKPDPANSQEWVAAYRNGRNLGSGSLWNNKRAKNTPLTIADKKPGEWNTFLVRMVGDKVTIWLNGKLIVDRTQLENFWDKTRKTPLARADQIELQHHGSELFFKNMYIRELPY